MMGHRDEARSGEGLTFELSGRQRQDAKLGLVKMYEYHQPGLGGLPLVLRLSEGLGRTLKLARRFAACPIAKKRQKRG